MPPIYDAPREATERTAGRIRKSYDIRNPRTSEATTGKRMPSPLDERALVGGPQRPKIKVETNPVTGGRDYVIQAYHAQLASDPELTAARKGDVIHAGSLRAARHRASRVIPGTETGYDASVRPEKHRMYRVEARVPEEEFFGSRSPISDYHANQLQNAYRGEGAAFDTANTYPRETAMASKRQLGAIGYRNDYEDPGSISYALSGDRVTKLSRLYDAASTGTGLIALLGTAAQFIPGFSERMPRTDWLLNGGPMGDVLNYAISQNYAPGGVMDPYKDMRDLPGFNPATGTVPA